MILEQGAGEEQQLYLNELLPLELYKLHMAAKQHKARIGWVGYLWIQNSRILARKGQDKAEKVFEIKSLDDLNKMS